MATIGLRRYVLARVVNRVEYEAVLCSDDYYELQRTQRSNPEYERMVIVLRGFVTGIWGD